METAERQPLRMPHGGDSTHLVANIPQRLKDRLVEEAAGVGQRGITVSWQLARILADYYGEPELQARLRIADDGGVF